MRLNSHLRMVLALALSTTMVLGCPSDDPPADTGADTSTGTDDAGTGTDTGTDTGGGTGTDTGTDTGTTTDVDACDGMDPQIACQVQIGNSFRDFASLDNPTGLTEADEPNQYQASPGFQLTFVAQTTCIDAGAEVALTFDGTALSTDAIAPDGTALFAGETLSEGGTPVTMEVVVDGETYRCPEVTFNLNTGKCDVSLSPEPGNECLTADADPSTPDLDLEFVVTNDNGKCDTAFLTYDFGGGQLVTSKVALVDGSATIALTLNPGVNAADLEVQANVESNIVQQSNQSPLQTYTVDDVPPGLTLQALAASTFGTNNDADLNKAGIQINVCGSVTGLGPFDTDSISCMGTDGQSATATPDGNGDFCMVFDYEISGIFIIGCVATDSCGQADQEATVEFAVSTNTATLAILSPADGTILLAAEDGNPATTQIFETTFEVSVLDAEPGFTLVVECRKDADNTAWQIMGTKPFPLVDPSNVYQMDVNIAVSLTGPAMVCRVSDTAINKAEAAEVAFVAALPAPTLMLDSPASDALFNMAGIQTLGSATGLNGQAATVIVTDDAGVEQSLTTVDAAFQSGGFDLTAWLTDSGLSGGTALADGSYTIRVQADDQWGNPACNSPGSSCEVTVQVDATAPVLSLTAPAALLLNPDVNPDSSAVEPGYQTAVIVQVADNGNEAGATVCISLSGFDLGCSTVADGETSVTWPAVTLQPGVNTLDVTGTDLAGNMGVALSAPLTLVSDAPVVTITVPSQSTSTLAETLDVTVSVADSAGANIDPETVGLTVNGADSGITGTSTATGVYTFAAVPLSSGDNILVGTAEIGALSGASTPVNVVRKDSAPTIAIDGISNGQIFNIASTECIGAATSCALDVTCTSVNLDDGSSASLLYSCGGEQTVETGTVSGDSVTFSGVALPNNSNCSLECVATDKGTALDASSGLIAVKVDRTAPTFTNWNAPSVPILIFADDLSPFVDGLQYQAGVFVANLEAGQAVTLDVTWDGGGATQQSKTLETSVGELGAKVGFGIDTYPGIGTLTFTANTVDAAGNPAEPSSVVVQVVAEQPLVRINNPTYIVGTDCGGHDDCTEGLCIGATENTAGTCGIGWGTNSDTTITVVLNNVMQAADSMRLCSNHPVFSGEAECEASGAGFHQMVTADSSAPIVSLAGSSFMPPGVHTITAEAMLADGSGWWSSVSGAVEDQNRLVLFDLSPPTVSGLGSPTDTNASGCLDGGETSGIADFTATCSQSGSLQVKLAGQVISTQSVDAGAAATVADVALIEGGNSFSAICVDVVGNASDPVTYDLEKDTTAPVLDFTAPIQTPILSGDSRDVALLSDEIGGLVTLSSNNAGAPTVAPTAVEADGSVSFAHADSGLLIDGSHTLTATVVDTCGNVTLAQTQALVVDTAAPTVSLDSPASGTALADGDDSSGDSGFQTAVTFSTTGDATSYEVRIQSGCGAGFSGCGAAAVVSSGAITNAGGSEPAITVTLPLFASPEHLRITAWVTDDAGNTMMASSDVTVTVSACTASIAGLPASGQIANALCPTGGADCDTVELTFDVDLVGACSAVTSVDLLLDNAVVAQAAKVGDSATFTRVFSHATTLQLTADAKDVGDATVVSAGAVDITVDLHAPTPNFVAEDVAGFTTPATGANESFSTGDDQSAADGLQIPISLSVTDDGFGGGTFDSLDCGGAAVGAGLPADITGTSDALSVAEVTLADAETTTTCTVTATDDHGNTASASFTYTSDTVPPAAVDISIASSNRRRPAVTLNWTSVGDDGSIGGAAASYELRYSLTEINDANFDSACDATALLTDAGVMSPSAPSGTDSHTITGPDARSGIDAGCVFVMQADQSTAWHFAVRAVDDAGNKGPITSSSETSTTGLSLRNAVFDVPHGQKDVATNTEYNQRVHALGDINDDTFADFAMGGSFAAELCIFYGSSQATVPDTIVDPDTDPTGANHQCIGDGPVIVGGAPAKGIGNFTGSASNDFAAAWGFSIFNTVELRVYGGAATGQQVSSTPVLTISGTGTFVSVAMVFAGDGDFNGDGFTDILIANANQVHGTAGNSGVVWVIPGGDTLPQTTLDLSSAVDLATFNVQTIKLVGTGGTPAYFGGAAAFVGNVLSDAGATQYDDIAISAWFTNDGTRSAAYVLRGRPTASDAELAVSSLHNGTNDAGEPTPTEDASSTILRPEFNNTSFGTAIMSADWNGDGIPEVFIGHTVDDKNDNWGWGYIFDGESIELAEAAGPVTIYGAGNATGTGEMMNTGINGSILRGPYGLPTLLGNFADDPAATGADLSAIGFVTGADPAASASETGKLYIRLNTNNPDDGFGYGTFPWTDLKLDDPVTPGSQNWAQFEAVGVGDYNGDGLPDVLVGTKNDNYSILFY